ncbi:DUF6270 domain-containing protein [Arthrobacter citreus]|uniref:DUF6270 domain-containing protein n=1 Tax=Arthrobacter TaxID=1663 RepID=UPI0024835786|nr:DUF6270 domain-containing protein [Arthrobacter gandavensis]
MTRVFIYGSCVTRDAEPWFKDFDFEMVGYVARQSLISAFSKANVSEYDFSKISSSFQSRMMRGDVEGRLRFDIQASKPDIVVWDICDERLGVKSAATGGMVTHVRDHVADGIHPGPFGSLLRFGDDAHFVLWERSLDQLLEALSRYGLAGKLYLNATPWAIADEQGNDHNGQAAKAEEFNRAAERYIDLARSKGVHIVAIPQGEAISLTDGHRWGPAPFHYVDDTYSRMLETLSSSIRQVAVSH